jgi:phosphate-selective porin O/P
LASVASSCACAIALGLLPVGAPLHAQYPVNPSPVLDPTVFGSDVSFGGLLILRHTQRNDTGTSIIRNARFTAQGKLRPTLLLKLQADFAAAGKTSGDSTVNGFAVTDAFFQFAGRDTTPSMGRLYPAILAGQFKVPFSLEYLTPVGRLLTANRSQVVDRLSIKRDIGAMTKLDWAHVVSLYGAVMSGEGQNSRANTNGAQLAVARLAVQPYAMLSIGGKLAADRGDHLSGYDVRWTPGEAVVEGEVITRRRSDPAAPLDGSGGYAAIAYRVLPWLQPVVKWEQYDQAQPGPFSTTWFTAGANVSNLQETLRAQLDVIRKHDHPIGQRTTELVVQLIAYF